MRKNTFPANTSAGNASTTASLQQRLAQRRRVEEIKRKAAEQMLRNAGVLGPSPEVSYLPGVGSQDLFPQGSGGASAPAGFIDLRPPPPFSPDPSGAYFAIGSPTTSFASVPGVSIENMPPVSRPMGWELSSLQAPDFTFPPATSGRGWTGLSNPLEGTAFETYHHRGPLTSWEAGDSSSPSDECQEPEKTLWNARTEGASGGRRPGETGEAGTLSGSSTQCSDGLCSP